MFLSKYQNPPYRTPIRCTLQKPSSHSPQHSADMFTASNQGQNQYNSPSKRRRTDLGLAQDADSTSVHLAPRIDPLAVVVDDDDDDLVVIPPQGAESPRCKVAERLKGLQLFSSSDLDSHDEISTQYNHHQVRSINIPAVAAEKDDSPLFSASYPNYSHHHYNNYFPSSSNATASSLPPPPSSSLSAPAPFRRTGSSSPMKSSAYPNSHFKISKPKRRLSSPPPPPLIPVAKLADAAAAVEDRQQHQQQQRTALATTSYNLGAHSVIDDHNDDDDDDDDDGEGINGIGFRPTAAVAYARRQRRKQQVNEWRAREAKEARQKRFAARRGGDAGGGGGGGFGSEKRVVRFAGVS